jgi:hypothetical protein
MDEQDPHHIIPPDEVVDGSTVQQPDVRMGETETAIYSPLRMQQAVVSCNICLVFSTNLPSSFLYGT